MGIGLARVSGGARPWSRGWHARPGVQTPWRERVTPFLLALKSPDHMRRCEPMVRLVSTMAEQGKVVAAICHGPWMLCSTQALKGRRATCFFAIKDDVINAGADYVDAEMVRDRNIITSRKPDDLPAFMQAIIQAVREAKPALAGKR